MKLSRIPGNEPTVKHSFAFKQSTMTLLQQYQEMYMAVTGAEVYMKDMVEQMLLDFMTDDKAFQKALRQKQESAHVPVTPAVPPAIPVVAEVAEASASGYLGHQQYGLGADAG